MTNYWRCMLVCFFVLVVGLAGMYLGLCAVFVLTGN